MQRTTAELRYHVCDYDGVSVLRRHRFVGAWRYRDAKCDRRAHRDPGRRRGRVRMARHQVIELIALDACVRANCYGLASWLGEDQGSHSKSRG